MFPHHIIHAECLGGDIDLLCNRRTTIGFFPWRFVDGESSIGRCAAFVDDAEYEELMARKAAWPKTRFGDAYDPQHVESIERRTKRFQVQPLPAGTPVSSGCKMQPHMVEWRARR